MYHEQHMGNCKSSYNLQVLLIEQITSRQLPFCNQSKDAHPSPTHLVFIGQARDLEFQAKYLNLLMMLINWHQHSKHT